MKINPSSQQAGRQQVDQAAQDAARAAEARKNGSGAPPKAASQDSPARPDSVDVSREAKALSAGQESRSSESSLSPDRLQEIGQRLANGHYDSPEVIDQVARRISNDSDFLR